MSAFVFGTFAYIPTPTARVMILFFYTQCAGLCTEQICYENSNRFLRFLLFWRKIRICCSKVLALSSYSTSWYRLERNIHLLVCFYHSFRNEYWFLEFFVARFVVRSLLCIWLKEYLWNALLRIISSSVSASGMYIYYKSDKYILGDIRNVHVSSGHRSSPQ